MRTIFFAVSILIGGLLNAQGVSFTNFLVEGNNRFAFSAYHKIKTGYNSNFCFSPYCIGEGFAMAALGSDGGTANQVQRVLTYSLSFLPLYQYLESSLTTSAKDPSQLYFANALWIDKQVLLTPSFSKIYQRNFGEPLQTLSLLQDFIGSVNAINQWTAEKTKGKISPILDTGTFTPDAPSMLTTAFYVKAPWKIPCDRQTRYLPFYVDSERMINVEMIHSNGAFALLEEGKEWVVNVPFKENPEGVQLILTFVYTKESTPLSTVENDFTWKNWISWQQKMKEREISLIFPRFRLSNTVNLKKVFTSHGTLKIFEPGAELTGLTTAKNFYIGTALHKSYFKVDEKGADAFNLSIPSPLTSTTDEKIEEVSIDRSFAFILWDNKSGAILLIGRVFEP